MQQNNQHWKDNVSFYSLNRNPEEFGKYDIDTVPSFIVIDEESREIINKFTDINAYYYGDIQEFVINGDKDDN